MAEHGNQSSLSYGSSSSDDEDEVNAESSDARSSGEEEEEETMNMESDDQESTSDDSDCEVEIVERRVGKPINTQSSSSSSSKDSTLFVTLVDQDVLDCPICCEPLKIPIFQCNNGHLACSLCCAKVSKKCPTCTLPIGDIRCRAMEKVIEASRVSCPNAKYGCKENIPYGNRFSHEKLCVFTPCSCPIVNCNYTGYYKDLNNHVHANHKHDLILFKWDTPLDISLDLNEKTKIIQEEKDGEVIVVQVLRDLHAVFVSISCMAPLAPGVEKLSCSLVKTTVEGLLKQGFMVKNIQKVRNAPPEDGFMMIPNYLLSGIEKLDLQIRVGRGRSFVRT